MEIVTMENNQSKEEMAKELKKILDEACYAYYNTPYKTMSDDEFDKACVMYKKLTGKTYKTTTPPKKGKRVVEIEHGFENLVGTIDYKFQNLEDFKEWFKGTITEKLGKSIHDEFEVLVSEKYDGNSVAIEYENGKCKLALTRGEDGKGADLTPFFEDQELKVKDKNYIGIRYEAMISYANFDKLNSIKANYNDKEYVNPRSTVAGILSNDDGIKYKDFITLVPLALRIKDKDINRLEELELLNKYQNIGDIDFNAQLIEGNYLDIVEAIKEIYNDYITKREDLGYMIDGIVFEFVDKNIRKKLGYFSAGSPKFSCAIKFPAMEKTTYIEDIIFEVSPNGSGKITPSAIYQPVKFNGATMRKTSLANYKRFKELALGKGSKVMIEYRNDVLCYLTKLEDKDNENIEPIPFIEKCPICGGSIKINENQTFAYCDNPSCPSKAIGKINAYTSQVGMKGIELSTLQKIFDAGLIKTPADLYQLKYKQLSRIDGLGEKSAENIIETIKMNQPNDYDLLAGLSIPNLGKESAKIILNEMSFDQLSDINYVKSQEFKDRISKLEGIGPIMTQRISEELVKNNELLYDLLANVKFKATKRVKLDNQLIFVHTGDTDKKYFEDRAALKAYIESFGHKMTSAVSSKTNYLITETPDSGTVKNKKAKELGVKVITCKELRELLG